MTPRTIPLSASRIFRTALPFLLVATSAVYADMAAETLGDYYVNIAIANDGMGNGIDEAFAVTFKRIHTVDDATLQQLNLFDYYDGITYAWRPQHDEWRLYKQQPGMRPQRIQLVAMVFPPARKARYLLELFKASPKFYRDYNLEDNLQIIGLMGITGAGNTVAMDFISEYTPVNPDDPLAQSDVYFSNISSMFEKYANGIALSGFAFPTVSVTDQLGPDFIYKAIGRLADGEQQILDEFVKESNVFISDDERNIPSVIGDQALPALEIRYIYKPIRAKASNTNRYGSPKALFLPVQLSPANESPYYPIYVFPSAFADKDTLAGAITRELLHAQWWNAVSHLGQDGNRESAETVLREFLLRTPLPFLEKDINHGAEIAYDDVGTKALAFGYSMAPVLAEPIQRVEKHPILIESQGLHFPWTFDHRAIIPYDLHRQADIPYMTAVLDRSLQLNPSRERLLPLAEMAIRERQVPASGRTEERLRKQMIQAISLGYTLDKDARNQRLTEVCRELNSEIEIWLGSDYPVESLTYPMLDQLTAYGSGYAYDDLEWLALASQKLGISANLYLGLGLLMENHDVRSIDKISNAIALNIQLIIDSIEEQNSQILRELEHGRAMVDRAVLAAAGMELENIHAGISEEVAAIKQEIETTLVNLDQQADIRSDRRATLEISQASLQNAVDEFHNACYDDDDEAYDEALCSGLEENLEQADEAEAAAKTAYDEANALVEQKQETLQTQLATLTSLASELRDARREKAAQIERIDADSDLSPFAEYYHLSFSEFFDSWNIEGAYTALANDIERKPSPARIRFRSDDNSID